MNNKENEVINECLNNSPFVFLTGGAGVGKSTLVKSLLETSDKNISKYGTTGVASLLIGGTTIESGFEIPPSVYNPVIDIYKIIKPSKREAIKNTDIVCIDEVSMLRPDKLDYINYALQLNCNNKKPFGLKTILAIGDLYQLPPVVSSKSPLPRQYLTPYFFSAEVLKACNLTIIELTKVYRQTDQLFIDALNAIRVGNITTEQLSYLNLRVVINPPQDAVVLSPYNDNIKSLNEDKLSEVDGQLYTFSAETEGKINQNDFVAEKELKLKIGARVIIIRNANDGTYVNGSIGIVKAINTYGPISIKLDSGTEVDIFKQEWPKTESVYSTDENRNEQNVIGSIRQYPIKLAWGISIHKSQGATYEKAHIDLGRGAFASGQLYVALSRVKSYEGLTLARPIQHSDIIVDQRIIEFFKQSNIIRI
jgi:ATP-dependent DNA helicase PIF1